MTTHRCWHYSCSHSFIRLNSSRYDKERKELERSYKIPASWWKQQPRVTAKSGWITEEAARDVGERARRQVAACALALSVMRAERACQEDEHERPHVVEEKPGEGGKATSRKEQSTQPAWLAQVQEARVAQEKEEKAQEEKVVLAIPPDPARSHEETKEQKAVHLLS